MHLVVLADSSSSSDSSEYGLLALPIVFAVAFWWFTYSRYRNQDARNAFEQTPSTVSNLRALDDRVEHRRGLKSKTIDGRNEDDATAPIPIDKMWPDPTGPAVANPTMPVVATGAMPPGAAGAPPGPMPPAPPGFGQGAPYPPPGPMPPAPPGFGQGAPYPPPGPNGPYPPAGSGFAGPGLPPGIAGPLAPR